MINLWGVGNEENTLLWNGFKGQVVKARGIAFCGFCGKEFRK